MSVIGKKIGKVQMATKELILRHQLQSLLKENNLSAVALARNCGIAKQVISDWLAGSRPKHIDKVKVVADFFGVTIDQLCFGCTKHLQVQSNSQKLAIDQIEEGKYEVIVKKLSTGNG
ncbi:helix-turn-helix transcriptional regulator [bacterium]|nr:helix-turn-helix transcriptional regulator [bacterium]